MIAYPDTSFLCAIYRLQHNSIRAARHFEAMPEALHVTSRLMYEFRQSIRLQSFLHGQDPHKGFDHRTGKAAMAKLQGNIADGSVVVIPAEWADVHSTAERLSAHHTLSRGHRGFDLLHVATALHLGAQEFLTFDANQKKLARLEGLVTPL